MFAALVVTLVYSHSLSNSDMEVFLIYVMLVFAFPISIVVLIADSLLSNVLFDRFQITLEVSYLSIICKWMVYTALGYIQWFKICPHILNKLKGRSKSIE